MILTAEEVREKLRRKVQEVGGQPVACAQAHVTRTQLLMVLKGTKSPGIRLARWIGFQRVLAYEPRSE